MPYWTGVMLFSIDSRHAGRRTRNLLETMYAGQGRIAFKGQLFSAPMDWNSLLTQLQKMEAEEIQISLPVLGAVLAARVRISITSGLIDLNIFYDMLLFAETSSYNLSACNVMPDIQISGM